MQHKTQRQGLGFTLLEIVIVIAVLVILAGISVPLVKSMLLDAKANKIAEIAELVKEACIRYHSDTSRPAQEDTGNEVTKERHELFDNSVPGWAGPYLERPLGTQDHPLGKRIRVMNVLNDPADSVMQGGFKLRQNLPNENGTGNMLVFEEIPDDLALAVDGKLDGPTLSGAGGAGPPTWHINGKVVFPVCQGRGNLYIFLLKLE